MKSKGEPKLSNKYIGTTRVKRGLGFGGMSRWVTNKSVTCSSDLSLFFF